MIKLIEIFIDLFIDMAYYLMIGVTLVGVFNLFMNKEFIAKQLGKNGFLSSVKACLFGVPLPLCSCAVVPTGLYLKDKGASTATTTAFLISTPQTGVDSIVATYGMMGLTFAWFRPLAAFVSGVCGGWIIGLFDKEKKPLTTTNEVTASTCDTGCSIVKDNKKPASFKESLVSTLHYSYVQTVGDIAVHFLVGLLIATLISMYLPADLLVKYGLDSGPLAMLMMILIGLPMYICSTASIPIAVSFLLKGISPGAVFVFLFMGPFTNAASLSILISKLGKKVVALYVSVATLFAILFGVLLDILINRFGLKIDILQMQEHAHEGNSTIKIVIAIIFALLLLYSIGRKIMNKINSKKAAKATNGDSKTYSVYGMTCKNCSARLQMLFLKHDDIDNATVNNETNSATIWGKATDKTIETIVENAGFSMDK